MVTMIWVVGIKLGLRPPLAPQILLSSHHHSHRDNVTAPTGRPNLRSRLHFSHSRGGLFRDIRWVLFWNHEICVRTKFRSFLFWVSLLLVLYDLPLFQLEPWIHWHCIYSVPFCQVKQCKPKRSPDRKISIWCRIDFTGCTRKWRRQWLKLVRLNA